MLQEKHMIAALPANPYHCPKCGAGLIEHDAPVMIFDDDVCQVDTETHFFCPSCEIEWYPHQIPDHPLYEPEEYDPTECPNCHEHARREIDVEPSGNYLTHVYVCTECGKIWNVREHKDDCYS